MARAAVASDNGQCLRVRDRRRARAPRARSPRFAGCAHPARRARRRRVRAPSPLHDLRSDGEPARRTAPRPRLRAANVEWWSKSTFVSTAICGRRSSIDRSDSSPSATSHPSPAPRCLAELRYLAADQERRIAAELPQAERDHCRRRRLAVRTADDDRRPRARRVSARSSPRCSTVAAASTSGLPGPTADVTITSAPAGTFSALCSPITTVMPAASSGGTKRDRLRSEPPTSAPQPWRRARARSCRRRRYRRTRTGDPTQVASAISSSAISSAA